MGAPPTLQVPCSWPAAHVQSSWLWEERSRRQQGGCASHVPNPAWFVAFSHTLHHILQSYFSVFFAIWYTCESVKIFFLLCSLCHQNNSFSGIKYTSCERIPVFLISRTPWRVKFSGWFHFMTWITNSQRIRKPILKLTPNFLTSQLTTWPQNSPPRWRPLRLTCAVSPPDAVILGREWRRNLSGSTCDLIPQVTFDKTSGLHPTSQGQFWPENLALLKSRRDFMEMRKRQERKTMRTGRPPTCWQRRLVIKPFQ